MAFDGVKAGNEIVATIRDFIARSVAPVRERADKHDLQLQSLEHRLSRQGTHLQNLQDRIKALETKGDK